jgi:signal transduction histidine kinase
VSTLARLPSSGSMGEIPLENIEGRTTRPSVKVFTMREMGMMKSPESELSLEDLNSATLRTGELSIEIIDTGPGMNDEQVDGLFGKFHQFSKDNKSSKGTGLGLWITKKIIERMGGFITVTSAVGKGTVFKIKMKSTGFGTRTRKRAQSLTPTLITSMIVEEKNVKEL